MSRNEILVVVLLGVILTVPFLDKPVHIDDTFVLHVTKSILENPFDPFAGDIDWFGHSMPVWKATTNPPLLSYYLAPFAQLSDYSEWVMHLAMVPFYILGLLGTLLLAKRFTLRPWIPCLFVALGAPFLVSGNLMRDIPAVTLTTAGIAFFVAGADSGARRFCFIGSFLIGLAALTKYSAGVSIPVLALYALTVRKPRLMGWMAVSLGVFSLWFFYTWWVYGQPHPIYLLLERSSEGGIPWQDKYFGGLTILGSGLLLLPALLWSAFLRRSWMLFAAIGSLVGVSVWGTFVIYSDIQDLEFLFWLALGAGLLVISVAAVRNSPDDRESWFLLLWMLGPVLFSVFFVPFQAVRHLLPAFLPMALLLFRYLEQGGCYRSRFQTNLIVGLLLLQTGVGLLVHVADYEYAESYRDFASYAGKRWGTEADRVWFVGQWGWKFYALQAGFLQMHREGPYPQPGDLLVWPGKIYIGDAFADNKELKDRLDLLEERRYFGKSPFRTMSLDARASFYAVMHRRIPFRVDWSSPLEVMRVYRVKAQESERYQNE